MDFNDVKITYIDILLTLSEVKHSQVPFRLWGNTHLPQKLDDRSDGNISWLNIFFTKTSSVKKILKLSCFSVVPSGHGS